MRLLHLIRNPRNPHNETRLHLAKLVARYGYAIGAHSYGRPRVRFPETGRRLTIGRFCSFADRVEILLGGNHRTDWVSTYPFAEFRNRWAGAAVPDAGHHDSRGDVLIGSDVWFGSGAMVMSGVTVGHGAVVAARAVVTRDVAPYAIVAGAPARLVRQRFDDEIVAALLRAAWWDLPDDRIAALIPLLNSGRIAELIADAERLRTERPAG